MATLRRACSLLVRVPSVGSPGQRRFAGCAWSSTSLLKRLGSRGGSQQRLCSSEARATQPSPPIVEIDYETLKLMTPEALRLLRAAFVGPKAYGAIAVINIPGYGEKRKRAFRAGINLALSDSAGRERAAAVSNTYPGWSGTPGSETHPLQSSFLFNVKEELPAGKTDPYFGKNIFPSEEYRNTFKEFVNPMHETALEVLRGCDLLIEQDMSKENLPWSASGRSLHRLGLDGPALAGRFICYDSGFTREDKLLAEQQEASHAVEPKIAEATDFDASVPVKPAGHAGDGLASMRTHSTPVKSAGHAGDGLASMRTHSTPVKSAGHAGDGLASMRTHSTPVKSAGHAGDGLASMRTHSTPVKSAGHIADGLSSMTRHSLSTRLKSQVGDVQAAVRPHSTQTASTMRDQLSGVPARLYSEEDEVAPGGAFLDEGRQADEFGDYWLPWHIDSNFVTLLHKEMYAYEKDTSFAPKPEGAGLLLMNKVGDMVKLDTQDDALIVQMGAFGQIYAGGHLTACRHAVQSPRPPGIARFNFCNFWYVPWSTVCDTPPGRELQAVNKGWNSMMDESYLNITMKQSFAAFRQFMTSPEARLQFADSVRFKELSELFPLPSIIAAAPATEGLLAARIIVDVLTDLRCPFWHISQLNLERALENLGLNGRVVMRYRPVFLDPNVPKEGESLDDYLLREYGYSKEYAHSKDYPLRLAGLEAGVELNPHRRVVNTFESFCLVELAQELGKSREVVRVLARRYFEEAEDIADETVLLAAAEEAGIDAPEVRGRLSAARGRVAATYAELAPRIGEVPHFLLREQASGNGVELGGNRSVADWEAALEAVLEKSRFMGQSVPGPDGEVVWLAQANPNRPVSLAVQAQHGWAPDAWPYTAKDFERMDEAEDMQMYALPRFVHHLDEASLARLTNVYRSFFGAVRPGFAVLDLCSSWASHFPQELLGGARVVVHGLNKLELEANAQATEHHVQDLNRDPRLPWAGDTFDFVTMALSVQYLTDPRAVFAEMQRVLRPGGVALVAFSHRCFIEKAVRVWAEETHDGEGHVHLVCRYFQHSLPGGWQHLSSVDVSPGHGDPMWLVTAMKSGAQK